MSITSIITLKVKNYKEVKRDAIPGEYIKIVNANSSALYYENEDIVCAESVRDNGGVFANTENTRLSKRMKVPGYSYIVPDEYVVLENYQCDESIKYDISAIPSDELIFELARRLGAKEAFK